MVCKAVVGQYGVLVSSITYHSRATVNWNAVQGASTYAVRRSWTLAKDHGSAWTDLSLTIAFDILRGHGLATEYHV
jgi:hypothetical protein